MCVCVWLVALERAGGVLRQGCARHGLAGMHRQVQPLASARGWALHKPCALRALGPVKRCSGWRALLSCRRAAARTGLNPVTAAATTAFTYHAA